MKVIGAFLAFGLIGLAPELKAANAIPPNGVLVRVNDGVITFKDMQNRMLPFYEDLVTKYRGQDNLFEQKLKEAQEQLVEDLVEEQLILHEFKAAGYPFPETYLEDKVNKDIREHGDRLTLTKTLQATGLTYESYRAKVKERITIQLMTQHNVPEDPLISPLKIEKYYLDDREQFKVEDQVKLRMILLTNNPTDQAYSPKKMAEEILSKIKEGAPFEEMARIYHQGAQDVREAGGDWGWAERTVLRPDLSEKAFALKPGERSGVIEAADGCYLMLVEQTRTSHYKPLAEVRADIEGTLKGRERQRLRKKWIDRLKSKSFLQYF